MRRRAFLRQTLAAGVGAGMAGAGAPALGSVLPASPWRGSEAEAVGLQEGGRGDLRLTSNENPLGPSPGALEALLEAAQRSHRYGFDEASRFRAAVGAHEGLDADHVVPGYGSTEVLRMAVQEMARSGGGVVTAHPTFGDAATYAERSGIPVREVPLRNDWAHDLEAMRRTAEGADGPVLIYVCNPNNPTGTLTPSRELAEWLEEADDDVLFVVDEAYHEYVDDPDYESAVRRVSRRDNVLVARTFSKIYGLAGLRVGYGLAHPDLAARLRRQATQYNADGPSLRAAMGALEDADFVGESRRANRRGLAVLDDVLEELGLARLPAHGNFAMYEVGVDVDGFIERMRDEEGIGVGRPFPPLLDHNRVTIGRPEDMERFAAALRRFRDEGWI